MVEGWYLYTAVYYNQFFSFYLHLKYLLLFFHLQYGPWNKITKPQKNMMWKVFNINFTLTNSIEVVNAILLIKLLSQVLGCVTLQKTQKIVLYCLDDITLIIISCWLPKYIWDCRRSQILPSLAGFKIKIKIKCETEKYNVLRTKL